MFVLKYQYLERGFFMDKIIEERTTIINDILKKYKKFITEDNYYD